MAEDVVRGHPVREALVQQAHDPEVVAPVVVALGIYLDHSRLGIVLGAVLDN